MSDILLGIGILCFCVAIGNAIIAAIFVPTALVFALLAVLLTGVALVGNWATSR